MTKSPLYHVAMNIPDKLAVEIYSYLQRRPFKEVYRLCSEMAVAMNESRAESSATAQNDEAPHGKTSGGKLKSIRLDESQEKMNG